MSEKKNIPPTQAEVTLLVIDDDYLFRQSIVAYLEDSGYEVHEAENGQVGLARLRQQLPALVLTDLLMPVMSGLDLIKIIKDEAPETPVIVISGAGEMRDVIQALRLGAWDYLTKPIVDLAVLDHTVKRALERVRLLEQNKIYRKELEVVNETLKKNLFILEQDEEAGKSVQSRLLPIDKAHFGVYQFTYKIFPSLYLSGDFVDYFKINETQFGFYIADVSGHGVSSAFVTVWLKSLMAHFLIAYQLYDKTICQPGLLLEKLSQDIYKAGLGKYLTMIYGVMDNQSHLLEYTVGGHYPSPICFEQEKGGAYYLSGGGFPVGVKGKGSYKTEKMVFPKGGRLILVSDGVTEVLPAGSLEEKEQMLLKWVAEGGGRIQGLLSALGVSEERELPDDLTILLLSQQEKSV